VYATRQDIVDLYGEARLYDVADRDADGVLDFTAIDKALAAERQLHFPANVNYISPSLEA